MGVPGLQHNMLVATATCEAYDAILQRCSSCKLQEELFVPMHSKMLRLDPMFRLGSQG